MRRQGESRRPRRWRRRKRSLCPNPLPRTSKTRSKLRGGGRGCREGLLSHPSASNSPILGWWLLRGGALVDSGWRHSCSGPARPGGLGPACRACGSLASAPAVGAPGPIRVRASTVSVCVCACACLACDLGCRFCLFGLYWGAPKFPRGHGSPCGGASGQRPGSSFLLWPAAVSQMEGPARDTAPLCLRGCWGFANASGGCSYSFCFHNDTDPERHFSGCPWGRR